MRHSSCRVIGRFYHLPALAPTLSRVLSGLNFKRPLGKLLLHEFGYFLTHIFALVFKTWKRQGSVLSDEVGQLGVVPSACHKHRAREQHSLKEALIALLRHVV